MRLNCLIFQLIIIGVCACYAVQLDNWRFPYYQAAINLGCAKPSPSSMFWDDIGPLSCFSPQLWPDSSRFLSNHWTLEPSVTGSAQTVQTFFIDSAAIVPHYVNDKKQAQSFQKTSPLRGYGQLLSDLRYKNMTVRNVLDIDSRNKDDLDFHGKTDRIAAGKIVEAYCQIDWNNGFFRLGRLNRNWGPFPDRSLFLSSNTQSYDALEFKLAFSFIEFRHLFAAFPYTHSYIDAEGNNVNRYLSIHSLNFMIGRFGEIGIIESMLFSRNGWPDLQLVNPFSIYTVINTNGEGAGNLMVGLQWNVHPVLQNISLKGQVIVDDVQVDNKVPMDQEPNHWGADIGAYINDFLPMRLRHYVSLEYRYLSRWLYTVNTTDINAGQRYTYLGRSLGEETIDNDRAALSFFIAGKNHWATACGFSLNRQGANSLWNRWKNYSKDSLIAPDALGYRREPQFPSGIVERSLDWYIALLGFYRNFADFSLRLDNRWMKNKNNERTGSYKYDPLLSFSVSFHYCNFFLPLPE